MQLESLFLLAVPLVIFVWVLIVHLDKNRVRRYIEQRGNIVVSITWRMFGHGWMSENHEDGGGNRIYEVEYNDLYGNLKHVWSKTAVMSGVFLSEDTVISIAKVEGRPMTAEEKVVLLEEELRKARVVR